MTLEKRSLHPDLGRYALLPIFCCNVNKWVAIETLAPFNNIKQPSLQVCLMSQSWDNMASMYDQYMLTKHRDIVHVQTVSYLCISIMRMRRWKQHEL